MTRFTNTIKKKGGNILSNSHNVTTILFSRTPSSSTFSTLEHISLKHISTLPLLKHIYGCGFMSCYYRMLQKSIPIAAVPNNATIDPMYRGDQKKFHNRRHIAAVFAPAAIVQFFCSDETLTFKKFWIEIVFIESHMDFSIKNLLS